MKSILIHGITAVAGLALAYMAWTDREESESNPDEVTIFECTPDRLTRAELHEERRDVVLETAQEDGDRVFRFSVDQRPEHGDPRQKHFVGSHAAAEYLEKIAPLRAVRSLGELSAEQLTEVELAEPHDRLTLHCGDRNATFDLGGRAYGSGDRYARTQGQGPVYLIAADRLSGLDAAESQLMQREPHTFEPREIVAIRIHSADRDKRLLQHNRLDEARAEWVDAEDPERRNELYGNWVQQLGRLRVQEYLAREAQPGADLTNVTASPEAVLRVDYEGDDGALGFLEMQRVEATPAAYYARTETTRHWVRVPTSVAESIEEDVHPVLGLPPLERSPAPASTTPDAGVDAGAAGAAAQPTPPAHPTPPLPPTHPALPPGHP